MGMSCIMVDAPVERVTIVASWLSDSATRGYSLCARVLHPKNSRSTLILPGYDLVLLISVCQNNSMNLS